MQEKIDQLAAEGSLDELIEKLMQRLEQNNYISSAQPQASPGRSASPADPTAPPARRALK